jgi:hypothetical protein
MLERTNRLGVIVTVALYVTYILLFIFWVMAILAFVQRAVTGM